MRCAGAVRKGNADRAKRTSGRAVPSVQARFSPETMCSAVWARQARMLRRLLRPVTFRGRSHRVPSSSLSLRFACPQRRLVLRPGPCCRTSSGAELAAVAVAPQVRLQRRDAGGVALVQLRAVARQLLRQSRGVGVGKQTHLQIAG